jgi:hypothetical protein
LTSDFKRRTLVVCPQDIAGRSECDDNSSRPVYLVCLKVAVLDEVMVGRSERDDETAKTSLSYVMLADSRV